MHDAPAAVGDQCDFAGLAGFETDRSAGGDVKPLAASGGAVEREGGIGFGEVIVAADLDWSVAGVGDGERGARQAGIEVYIAGQREDFAWDHRIGSCTVTNLVPSENVASTCTSWIISATPSITCA